VITAFVFHFYFHVFYTASASARQQLPSMTILNCAGGMKAIGPEGRAAVAMRARGASGRCRYIVFCCTVVLCCRRAASAAAKDQRHLLLVAQMQPDGVVCSQMELFLVRFGHSYGGWDKKCIPRKLE
jgi:hypothetical protein